MQLTVSIFNTISIKVSKGRTTSHVDVTRSIAGKASVCKDRLVCSDVVTSNNARCEDTFQVKAAAADARIQTGVQIFDSCDYSRA